MKVDLKQGLSQTQYQQNIQQFGRNLLPEAEPVSKLRILLAQFTNPLVYILIIAALLALLVSFLNGHADLTEFLGIMAVVTINGVLGYVQENKAEETLSTLTQNIKPHCEVIRNGQQSRILSSELTHGDIVIVKLGDKIPADGVFLQASDVSINEAILTGESEPVIKSAYTGTHEIPLETEIALEHQVYMGTSIMSGIGRFMVTAIASNTKFGQIADSLISQKPAPTPLQSKIISFTATLTYAIGFISIAMVGWGLLNNMDFVEILELSISVAVAAIPEGLVIALTVILALGMRRILKRKAVVRKLVAAETLGSVSTICIDKTGTLTEGQMKVVQTFFSDEELARKAILATNHKVNAVEIALLDWLHSNLSAQEKDVFSEEAYLDYKIFDSTSKFSATKGQDYTYFVGAPEVVLEKTALTEDKKQYWEQQLKAFSKKGMRLVAMGYQVADHRQEQSIKQMPEGIQWLGLIVIEDPVRPDLAKVFKQANQAGIAIKVITGDFGETARAVMRKIGIDLQVDEMISGAQLLDMPEEKLAQRLDQTKLFYRTTPNQKLRIITALQNKGEVVAMMGDGINDTPALKKAEIGIVVENAADFSKEIADMVLLDSDFKTIIAAVEEGRGIFENMRKILAYLLTDAFDVLLLVFGATLLGLPSPLLPLQILYINFVTDGLPDLALAFEEPEHEVMKDKPKPKDYPLLDPEVRSMILSVGVVVSIALLGLYILFFSAGQDLREVRTFIFATLGLNSLFYVFSIRSFRKSLWQMNPFSNKFLNWGCLIGLLSLLAAIYVPLFQNILDTVPLTLEEWILIGGISVLNITIIEIIKHNFIVKRRNAK